MEEVGVVGRVAEDIVEKADTDDDQAELLDMQDVLVVVAVEDIVEAQVALLLSEDTLEDDRVEDILVDHLLAVRVKEDIGEVLVEVVDTLEDDRVEDILVDHLLAVVIVVDHHLLVVRVKEDIVEAQEVVPAVAIRKIDQQLVQIQDTRAIVIAMVDQLEVKHKKKRRKPLFLLLS
jgi:hypothetical protein